MARSGFSINKQAIAKMTREIQREFDKHPIQVPVQANGPDAPAAATTIYNAPVITVSGGRAQIAWDNRDVSQSQDRDQEIAPGFEAIAQALVKTLEGLPEAGLDPDDQAAAESAAREVLSEATNPEPDRGIIKRGVAIVRGILAPLALGAQAGANEGAQEWAKTAVEQLTSTLV